MRCRFALALIFVVALLSWRPLHAADGPPAPAQPGSRLVRVAGDNQTVQPGVPFALFVRVEGAIPLSGIDVGVLRVLSGGPVIECVGEATDAAGLAVVTCTAGFWPLRTQVFITVSDEAGRIAPDFGVTITPPVFTEGISSIGPTRLTVVRNQDFELAVRAISNGVPDEGLVLTVQRSPADAPVSCPNTVSTDVDGLARIICSSLDVGADVTVLITLSDAASRSETFTVLVLAQDELQDGVFKASGDDQAVPEGSVLLQPLVALVVREGRPAGGSRVTVSVSDPDLLVCAENVIADANGFAAITCASSIIVDEGLATNAFAAVEVQSDTLRLADPFRVSVVRGLFTVANSIRVTSFSPIRAEAGETREDAIRVEARNELDLPQASAPIYFSSNQNITFDPPVAITDPDGEASTSLTFGCPGGSGRVNVGVRPGLTVARVDVEVGTGEPNIISKLQGDGQSGLPGERLSEKALVVLVSDRCFNPGVRQPVSWRVEPPDAATLENVVERTDGRGRASVLVRLGDRPGPFEVTASFGGREQTFKLETLAIPGGLTAVSGQRQSIPRGELSEPLQVRLLTESGLAVPGRDVLFTVLSGDGFVTQSLVATDAQGRAATQFRAGDSFGLATVAATLPTAALSPEGAAQGALEALFEIVVGGRLPQVAAEGFVNGASFRAGWAPGGLGSIFGTGLMEDIVGIESARNAPFPTQLRGVSVSIDGIPAPIITLADFGEQQQINLQVPFEVSAPGAVTVVINNNGTERAFENVPVFPVSPGIFEIDVLGGRYAAALHADFRLVTPLDPALPGETILLFLTGLGQLASSVGTNQPGPVPAPATLAVPTVGIDDAGVVNSGGFYAPALITVNQVNFVVPADAPAGDRRLTLVAGGAATQRTLLPVGR